MLKGKCLKLVCLTWSLSLVNITGCGSQGGTSPTVAEVAGAPAAPSPQVPTPSTIPANDAGVTYQFVDDSFATEITPSRPEFQEHTTVVEAKDFGDGSFTGETIFVAVNAVIP